MNYEFLCFIYLYQIVIIVFIKLQVRAIAPYCTPHPSTDGACARGNQIEHV